MKLDDRKRIIENNYRLNLIYNKYKMLSLNMFRWEGLPETIESRHIENSLFNYGLCLIIIYNYNIKKLLKMVIRIN